MKKSLSQYFSGIGAKRLSQVEIEPRKSNQHEFNGVSDFKKILGVEKKRFKGRFIYLNDNEDEVVEEFGSLTWYDSREKHLTRSEHRLYYSSNEIILTALVGDLVIIGQTSEDELLVIVTAKGSTSEKQLLWLFGLEEVEKKFVVKSLSDSKVDIGFAGRYIISSLGIEVEEPKEDEIEELIRVFGKKFPSTSDFSAYARSKVKDISVLEAPDEALIAWLEKEESLFKNLESVIVKEKLSAGFGVNGTDVDEFINFSLSVQNRRKSRAGHSFENHLAIIFASNNIRFSKGKVTERNNKPDFIFPDNLCYHNPEFDVSLLTMLGVKTTAKDRWRQVLSEADKISRKHLMTLEPSISKNQTDEMRAQDLQLVVPKSIIITYQQIQQSQIINLSEFISHIKQNQSKVSNFLL